MVKKITKYLKFVVCCALIMSLITPSYAALSASDGSAFVTKAEFDAALADFNARLTTFESGINSKIDSQVSSYLDRNGIWNGKTWEVLPAVKYGDWTDAKESDNYFAEATSALTAAGEYKFYALGHDLVGSGISPFWKDYTTSTYKNIYRFSTKRDNVVKPLARKAPKSGMLDIRYYTRLYWNDNAPSNMAPTTSWLGKWNKVENVDRTPIKFASIFDDKSPSNTNVPWICLDYSTDSFNPFVMCDFRIYKDASATYNANTSSTAAQSSYGTYDPFSGWNHKINSNWWGTADTHIQYNQSFFFVSKDDNLWWDVGWVASGRGSDQKVGLKNQTDGATIWLAYFYPVGLDIY